MEYQARSYGKYAGRAAERRIQFWKIFAAAQENLCLGGGSGGMLWWGTAEPRMEWRVP